MKTYINFILTFALVLAFAIVAQQGHANPFMQSQTRLSDGDTSTPWQASFVSFSLGSQFFLGASGQRWVSTRWNVGARVGTGLDFSQTQSSLALFGRLHSTTQNMFMETSLTHNAGLESGSRLLGVGLGFRFNVSRSWMGEAVIAYEGVDRLLIRSAISSWSTARLQIGLSHEL